MRQRIFGNFLLCFLLFLSWGELSAQNSGVSSKQDTTKKDSLKLLYPIKDYPFINLFSPKNQDIGLKPPSNIQREITFDPKTKQYIITEKLGRSLYRPPQYLTFEEYQAYENKRILRENWEVLMRKPIQDFRKDRIIPTIYVESEVFERIFGGNTIDIIPRGTADITFKAQRNKNENPMFNERQRNQWGFDFDERIQMNLTGQIGQRFKITTNYNTQSQFDFENQIRLDYIGKDDDIIKRIEVGNVNLPLNTTLITGTEALFGVKTQLQFGRLFFTGVFSQQKSQQREIQIRNGAQESQFSLKADEYEYNQHFFLSQYFRDNFNKAMALAPLLSTNINITQIEVWVNNRTNAVDGSRDVLALLDLGEQQPYNTRINPGPSALPSTGIPGELVPQLSNDLLRQLPETARETNNSSEVLQSFFAGQGGNDNYAKITYARKLREGTDYTINRQLGFISLRMPLQGDQILAVAYRYTANGREYQVGELSYDVPVTPSEPKMLYTKLLKNEVLKTNLPTWKLMMKNIYSIGAYNVGRNNFRFQIYRVEDESGVERPVMYEGEKTANKLWIQVTGLDRLNAQEARQPDGFFDYLPNLTIDSEVGKIMFPVLEPFGRDLESQFNASEQEIAEKYVFKELYDETKASAQQNYPHKNRYIMKGTYESETGTEYFLGAMNIPHGSVMVYAGTTPLQEGVDYQVDYYIGRVRILNQALLMSGQPIRIKLENNNLFGMQQRTLMGGRFDFNVNEKLQLGSTIMRMSERPMSQKVSIGDEPVSNTIWGFDLSYNSTSRWLTRMVDKIPFIDTKEESQLSFYSEFAQLNPGAASALNFAGSKNGTTYIDDFENSRSYIDMKGANGWYLSGTPQLFEEHSRLNDLSYGYNRARLAIYNIDPIFYRRSPLTPNNITNQELSKHRVREVLEQEVFPYKEPPTGLPMYLPTLDLAFYPTLRGPNNYTTEGVLPDGRLMNPKSRWGGVFKKIDAQDFEAQNVEFIEMWMMDPFLVNPGSTGGELYFNLGNISEDILKDGRKSLENGLSPTGDLSEVDETVWGRVPKKQPVIQAFDNDAAKRARQDVGLDGLSDDDEKTFFASELRRLQSILNPAAYQDLLQDPSGDNFKYFRGSDHDATQAGILERYMYYNGTEGNAKTSEQSQAELGLETSASTLLPDGEDINRDNNMNETEEYFEYKIALRPDKMEIGLQYIADVHEAEVALPNGRKEKVKWYQFRIPLSEGEAVGGIQDFKSVRFMRMFMTGFEDTTVLRLAQLQLVRGEWRRYNAENDGNKVITDPNMGKEALDQSKFTVSAINIEQNGSRSPIPYVVPPGIERQLDWGNMNYNIQLNEQSLAMEVLNLRDGHGRAAFRTTMNDFRPYGRLKLYVHAEALPPGMMNSTPLYDGDLRAFIRFGTDDKYNYYQYDIPLKLTQPGTSDPNAIWPEENHIDVAISLFQKAKMERFNARLNGFPWPLDVPFVYREPGTSGRVILLGQPDISKVRFYMLGVMNTLKGSDVANSNDDGLEKSAQVWFNELRLTDFDRKGGWAATARLQAKLADFADVTVSSRYSTIGFGSLDQRIGERNRSDDFYFDVVSNAELGKFFKSYTGIRIPFYFSYTNQRLTPEYNPLEPDMKLNTALANLNRNKRDSLMKVTQDYTRRRSFSFTNVRKVRTDIERTARPWDIENWSASYSFAESYQRDYLTEKALQQHYRGALDYTYSASGQTYIEPFKKWIKSDYLGLLRDFNFNLMPSLLHFRVDINRVYNENSLRNNSPDNYLPVISTLYNKNFNFNRVYGISWNLSRQLKLDFNATNYAIVDEPQGRINGLKRDTLMQNFWRLGRTTDYNHQLNVTYTLPLDRVPGMDWIQVDTRYGAQFNWKAEPRFAQLDTEMSLGNSIQNGRTIQINPRLSINALYQKFGFIRRHNSPQPSGFVDYLVGLLTSVKDVNGAYTRVESSFLPGYLPITNSLGYDFDYQAPGWQFLLGSQQDIRFKAANAGWITRDSLQNQLYMTSRTEDLSLRAIAEPFKRLQIDFTVIKQESKNYTSNFIFDSEARGFENRTPFTSGTFAISFNSISTAFKDQLAVFKQFEKNKQVISERLGAQNPNSLGIDEDGFADGYRKNAQEVVVNAFLATYGGKDISRFKLAQFPKIPIPSWNVNYTGLSEWNLLKEVVSSISITHGYNGLFTINGFQSTAIFAEQLGFPSQKDANGNFLPKYQFQQVSIIERFTPLLGVDVRFKNGLTLATEYRKDRTLNLSLQNSQLSLLDDRAFVFGLGYRTANFHMPFGWFDHLKLTNDLNFRMDFSLNDLKTVVYRADEQNAEISAGNKSVSIRPSLDYMINQRFNLRIFYDSNAVRPYTSQTFATSYANFGFTLRATLQ